MDLLGKAAQKIRKMQTEKCWLSITLTTTIIFFYYKISH